MASPARLHKQREEARRAAERAATEETPVRGSAHELALAQLAQDKRQLKEIQSTERRQERKAELMAENWNAYIDGALAADSGAHDPVISQMLPWCFDVGDIERALRVGDYLVRHDLPAPESFARSAPALYAELAAEAWLQTPDGKIPPVSALQLGDVLDAVSGHDMVDEIVAKLHRALGEALYSEGDNERALDHLRRAVELNAKVGAKPLIAKIEKEIAEQAAANQPPSQ
ncbi:Phage small terminase subunit [Cardiobacterium hominis]|uniref:Phage small terminase subunit n=1 Tax=Cardiobacterium hominis (strain ATCC 15826 / DSM 8339 / NCTC 10426 / 6573) TaxID=638300 RepID=C8N780_CARH6|nr:phage terminase small subunit [Cardiobacterium hominis]EEV89576.1 phage small terminase subunit [Cardiobacterium hominis ATCC 15826]VEG76979.1 Phage small terminase subunit [Cardiobacterium hominis]